MNLVIKNNAPKSFWPIRAIKGINSSVYGLGSKTATLIGLGDLRLGMEELYLGEYGHACKYLVKGAGRLVLTAITLYTTYKIADYIKDVILRWPVEQEKLKLEKCSDYYKLRKWEITSNEYYDSDLQNLLNRPEIDQGKNYLGDKLNFKRNFLGEILFPLQSGGYERWSRLKEIEQTVGLVVTENGFAPLGAPYSIKPNDIAGESLVPGHYVDFNTWYHWFIPYQHNGVRIREVTEKVITTHSFGFYPENPGFFRTVFSTLWPQSGRIASPDPREFDISEGTNISQTSWKLTKEQYDKIKAMMLENHGGYHPFNVFSSNCRGFVNKVLKTFGQSTWNWVWFLPSSIGHAISTSELGITITDTSLIKI